MAGNIQNVNVTQLRQKVNEYNSKIMALREDLLTSYNGFKTLRNYWTGKRMNAVIEKYNSSSKKILDSVQFFNKTVSSVLLEICEQYKNMEEKGVAHDLVGSYTSGFEEIATPIELTSIENVKFEQDKVTNTVTSIQGGLENIGTTLSSLVNILDDLKTCSDSLNKLVTNYNAAADTMISNLTEIRETLKTEIDNAVKVVQTTEQYNDSDASRVQSGGTAE